MSTIKVGDKVRLKEKFAGRYYPGKVIKIRKNEIETVAVVSQPNNMVASFPIDKWQLDEEADNSVGQ